MESMESHKTAKRMGEGHKDLECPQCGTGGVRTYRHRHTFTYGSEDSAVELTVEVPVRRCASCGFEYLDAEAEQLKHEAVCRHFAIVSAHE